MSKKNRKRFHTGFTHEATRSKNRQQAVGFNEADLYFLQMLGKIH